MPPELAIQSFGSSEHVWHGGEGGTGGEGGGATEHSGQPMQAPLDHAHLLAQSAPLLEHQPSQFGGGVGGGGGGEGGGGGDGGDGGGGDGNGGGGEGEGDGGEGEGGGGEGGDGGGGEATGSQPVPHAYPSHSST